METMPAQFLALLAAFAPAFTPPTWDHACRLITGTVLSSGRRTIARALRAGGRGEERHFTTYQRVLKHATWSPLLLSRVLRTRLLSMVQAKDRPVLLEIAPSFWCWLGPWNDAGGARLLSRGAVMMLSAPNRAMW
jgi:hypothetical protein